MNEQTKIDDGGPAFPLNNDAVSHDNRHFSMQGMTLRDYFAAQAINLFCFERDDVVMLQGSKQPNHDLVAKTAYDLADAMLKARKREKGHDCETTPATPPTV